GGALDLRAPSAALRAAQADRRLAGARGADGPLAVGAREERLAVRVAVAVLRGDLRPAVLLGIHYGNGRRTPGRPTGRPSPRTPGPRYRLRAMSRMPSRISVRSSTSDGPGSSFSFSRRREFTPFTTRKSTNATVMNATTKLRKSPYLNVESL